jgi:hypothetical protein
MRMASMLFDCARTSLLALCADTRHLGAKPGLLMALHTWGRTLNQHPHVHCLVSAGGVSPSGEWHDSRSHYLLPVKALASLFRGKLLYQISQALHQGRLTLPPQQDMSFWLQCIRKQYRQHWNVQISDPYAHGRGVALYLARYAKGGPLPADRPLTEDGETVSFEYLDHRDHQPKRLQLNAQEFIRRVLWHAPASHQHMIRRAGLYASRAKCELARCTQSLRAKRWLPAVSSTPEMKVQTPTCAQCQQVMTPIVSLLPAHRFGEKSLRLQRLGLTPTGSTSQWSGQSSPTTTEAPRRHFFRRRLPLT